jgi:AraC family transcriptional regulator
MAGLVQTFMEKVGPERIQVRQGEACVPLAPGSPTVSSGRSGWDGAILELHSHGPHNAEKHQHLSHFLCLHLSEPAPVIWRSEGKQESGTIKPGSLILLSRGTEDAVTFPKAVRRILLNLEPSVFEWATPDHKPGRGVELVNHWGVEDRQVEYLLRALEADLEAGLPSGQLFGESLLCALAVHLERSYGVTVLREQKVRNGLPKARLRRVLDFIESNLDREITLGMLAETAGMSPHYFSVMFKQSTTFSPHQYVLRTRIELARRLLNDSRVTIFEAAVRTGFSDQSHFTKIFRRIVGVTPTAYRAAL